MRPFEIDNPASQAHLDAGEFPGRLFDIRHHVSEMSAYPELVKTLFDPFPNYHLEATAAREEYLKYLSEVTGLQPGFTGEDVVKAMERMPEKAVAHTVLALSGITEDESRIMPLTDVSSIIDYAHHLYESGEHPWFDFVVEEDIVKKTATEVNGKKSAPLFTKCDTFTDFLREVIPVIKEYQEKDPKAFLKIFPQTKNVETFNIGISHKPDGSTTWIVEWHPGAYTPREGDDGHKGIVLVKDKTKDKEERIVRTIIEFDKDGHAAAFVKPPKDPRHPDNAPPPLKFPVDQIDLASMFKPANIVENHDSMASSSDPFVLLKYIASHPGFQEMLTKFHSLHEKLGYADLILSGMIGPDTVFGMDIDFQSDKSDESSAKFLARKISEVNQVAKPLHANQAFHNLANAFIFSEKNRGDIIAIPAIYLDIFHLFELTHDTGYIELSRLKSVASQLGLLPETAVSIKHGLDSTPNAHISNQQLLAKITESEVAIIQNMLDMALPIEITDEKVLKTLKGIHEKTSESKHVVRPWSFIKPGKNDVYHALKRLYQDTHPAISPKKVSEL